MRLEKGEEHSHCLLKYEPVVSIPAIWLQSQISFKTVHCQAVVVHAFNSSIWGRQADLCEFQAGRPGLQREFQDGQSYPEKPFPKKQTNKIF